MRNSSRSRIKSGGLDAFRIIAAVMIITIHTSPLESFNQNADFFLTRVLSRVAVPFFFMVTGQFVVSEIIRKSSSSAVLAKYIKKTALIYAVSIIIYIPIGIYAGHYSGLSLQKILKLLIFDGTFYHLWYFPALITGCALIFILSRFMTLPQMTAAAALLYIIGLFGDSYFGFVSKIPVIENIYNRLFNIFSYTRNGLFFAPLFLLMGVWVDRLHIRARHKRSQAAIRSAAESRTFSSALCLNVKMCAAGLIISFCAMTAEAFALHLNNIQRHDSMYIMLIPVMFFLYMTLLNLRMPQKPTLRPLAAIVYVIHPAVIVAVRAAAKPLKLKAIFVENSLVHFFAVAVLSFLIAAALLYFISGNSRRFRRGKIKKYENKKLCTGEEIKRLRHDEENKGLSHGKENKRLLHDEENDCRRSRAWIELNLDALAKNVYFLQSLIPNGELMPAVKADAYGHGAVIISKELNKLGIRSFCVACVDEAVELRKNGIKGDILILGYTHPNKFHLLRRYNLIQTVVDYDYAIKLNQYKKPLRVHLGIDTGMHRLGIRSEDTDEILKLFGVSDSSYFSEDESSGVGEGGSHETASGFSGEAFSHNTVSDFSGEACSHETASDFSNLKIEGIFTHLSADDGLYPAYQTFTKNQALELKKLIDTLKAHNIEVPKLHLLSSYGLLNYPQLAGDYARTGIALYGVLSSKDDDELWQEKLTPVLSLKARVSTVRTLHKGECAGYSMAFTAHCEMKIAALTIGYADGLPRSLSNGRSYVLINGKKAPVIGLICMDQTIVDVSDIENVKAGDTAVIIGSSGNLTVTAAELAENAGTITNELLSRLGKRLERLAFSGNNCYNP